MRSNHEGLFKKEPNQTSWIFLIPPWVWLISIIGVAGLIFFCYCQIPVSQGHEMGLI